ncbi:MAG TPA: sulfatase-like hydrolase/transferase [Vicinamibacterales bacterium]|nr:sulfatase-like hydrolase/transferase [Vicinamibacterales bacterium]
MTARCGVACASAIAVTAIVGGCDRRDAPGRPPPARNLLLVTIDTLRADRLGCYGSRDVATPTLDRLAGEGALAMDATVHTPLTRPSHVSLFTGRYPAEHGIRDNIAPALADSVPTLATILSAAGFRTGAFVSSIVLSAQSGLNRGFDTYSARFEAGVDDARFLNTIQRRGDETVADAIGWLQKKDTRRFAVWVHLYEPHDPYEPPEPYLSRYAGRPYDGEVAWSDELVGRLLRALESERADSDTLVVVTSDHGEGLGDHDESTHGYFVYESTLRVPLIFRGPRIARGLRVAPTVRAVDILPTVLELMDLPRYQDSETEWSGRSIAASLDGGPPLVDVATYAESLTPLLHYGWSDLRTIRDGRWKYILAPRAELYDLQRDPAEQKNLAMAQPARADALRAALETRLRAERNAPVERAAVPPELLEQLGALGYVSPGAGRGDVAAGADPKDRIGEYKLVNRLMREGLTALRERRFAVSVERLNGLVGRGIDSFEVHYYLGRALAGVERHREAASHFARAVERLPASGAAHLALADAQIAMGDLDAALAALHRGQASAPKHPELYEREAAVWRRRGRLPAAIAAYEKSLALLPKDGLIRVRLGEALRDQGDLTRASALLEEAVRLEPDRASYWNSLGMILGGSGDLAESERAFREAVTRDPANAQYRYNLGLALLRQRRQSEAITLFRETLARDPSFSPARQRLSELGTRP